MQARVRYTFVCLLFLHMLGFYLFCVHVVHLISIKLGLTSQAVAHTFYPRTQEAEAEASPPGMCREILFQANKQKIVSI